MTRLPEDGNDRQQQHQQQAAHRPSHPHPQLPGYATHLIEAGIDLIEVQKYLGHHSILTTVRYTHLTDKTKHHAIERINALMDGFNIAWGRVKVGQSKPERAEPGQSKPEQPT